jgi:pSer/pThr/pTyr-binding forkhead associated (FHA) protein
MISMANFEVYFADGRVENFELGKASLTVGRSVEADIHIDDPVVSRLHARVDKANRGRWSLTDLDSRNETYFEGQAIKTRILTNNDILYFGSIKVVFHDPSGTSDEPMGQTIYKKVQAEVSRPARNKACPNCRGTMAENAVVCTECGYNLRTGETMKVNVEEVEEGSDVNGTTVATSPKLRKKEESPVTKNQKPVSKQWLMFRDFWLPTGLIVLGILVNFAALAPLYACATIMGMIFDVVLILFAIALVIKFGGIDLGSFGTAILKIFAMSAVIGMFNPWAGQHTLVFIFSLSVLVGLIKFFFDPRMLEWFTVAVVSTLLNFFVVYLYAMPTLRTMIETMNK